MITSTTQKLLKLLPLSMFQQGYSQQAWLAMKLQIKKGSVSKTLQRLEAKGIIKGFGKTTNRYYEIVQSCPKPVQSPKLPMSEVSHTKPSQAKRIYLHRLLRSYLLAKPSLLKHSRSVELNNNTQQLSTYKGISYRTTTKHLLIEGIQLEGSLALPAPYHQNEAEKRADEVALGIEQEQGLKLQRNATGGFTARTSLVEISITDHKAAESLTDRVAGKIILYEHPLTHKLLWSDRTPSPASIESDSANLLVPWQQFTKDLEEYNGWEQMKANVLELTIQTKQFAEQMNIHAPVFKAIEEVAEGMRSPSKRERARQAVHDLSNRQRRLL